MINFGRNIGYSLDSERKASYSFDGDGRMSGMSIGENKDFSFGYLPNTYIQNTINYPNGLVKTVNFEKNRNLISSVEHGFTDSMISKYSYTNDLLGRRTSKVQHFDNTVKNFDFGYNPRSEVTSATEQNNPSFNYGFNYDNIGNRISAHENGITKSYTANNLNQYSAVDTEFTPEYDADGNQTRIKTSTGIWEVEYNAENRPIMFKNANKRIHNMSYDYMGRRFCMSSYFQGMHDGDSTELFYYNGYTLIESVKSLPWPQLGKFIKKSYIWDPTVKKATRPLVMIDNNNEPFYYTHDANKNVTELISQNGIISAHYEYSPFGAVTVSSGDLALQNNFTFSSEYIDLELGLVYYNYRHYNALDGRWISRDPIEEQGGYNLYGMVNNNPMQSIDVLGLLDPNSVCDYKKQELTFSVGFAFKWGLRATVTITKEYGTHCCDKNDPNSPKKEITEVSALLRVEAFVGIGAEINILGHKLSLMLKGPTVGADLSLGKVFDDCLDDCHSVTGRTDVDLNLGIHEASASIFFASATLNAKATMKGELFGTLTKSSVTIGAKLAVDYEISLVLRYMGNVYKYDTINGKPLSGTQEFSPTHTFTF